MAAGFPARRIAGRFGRLAWLVLAAVPVVACGSAAGGTGTGSDASCAFATPAQYLARAQVAFVGTMLAGPADQGVLLSPARVRVQRYLKGAGPAIVPVLTGLRKSGSHLAGTGEGIRARAGQRWRIYATSAAMPLQTSDCDGSSQVSGSQGS